MKRLVYTFFMVLATIGLSFAQTNFSVSVGGAGLSFSPANLTITPGDSVTWTNAGGFHNVNEVRLTILIILKVLQMEVPLAQDGPMAIVSTHLVSMITIVIRI
ncbi:MAG: hypothetical protein AAFP83_09405 [Bacteroidota bacterium]